MLLNLMDATELGLRNGLKSSSSDANNTGNCDEGRRDTFIADEIFLEIKKKKHYWKLKYRLNQNCFLMNQLTHCEVTEMDFLS